MSLFGTVYTDKFKSKITYEAGFLDQLRCTPYHRFSNLYIAYSTGIADYWDKGTLLPCSVLVTDFYFTESWFAEPPVAGTDGTLSRMD